MTWVVSLSHRMAEMFTKTRVQAKSPFRPKPYKGQHFSWIDEPLGLSALRIRQSFSAILFIE